MPLNPLSALPPDLQRLICVLHFVLNAIVGLRGGRLANCDHATVLAQQRLREHACHDVCPRVCCYASERTGRHIDGVLSDDRPYGWRVLRAGHQVVG